MSRTELYERALAAEPELKPIETMVDLVCSLVRPDDVVCAACAWEDIVKPLATPLVGWGRGYAPPCAADPQTEAIPKAMNYGEFVSQPDPPRTEATTETERWLRTAEAFDAVTDTWMDKLHAVDPGNGHGLRGSRGAGPRPERG